MLGLLDTPWSRTLKRILNPTHEKQTTNMSTNRPDNIQCGKLSGSITEDRGGAHILLYSVLNKRRLNSLKLERCAAERLFFLWLSYNKILLPTLTFYRSRQTRAHPEVRSLDLYTDCGRLEVEIHTQPKLPFGPLTKLKESRPLTKLKESRSWMLRGG